MKMQEWADLAERQFIAAVIAGHVALTLLFQFPAIRPDFPAIEIIADTLPFTQSVLLIGWGLLGPGLLSLRLLAILGLAAVYGIWTLRWGMAEAENVVAVFAAIELGTAAVCLGLLASGQRVCFRDPPPEPARWQYSLRWLLLMMTLYAVLIVAGNGLRQSIVPLANVPAWIGWSLLGLTFAAVTLITTWAVLKAENPWLGGIIALAAAPLLGMLLTWLVGRDRDLLPFAGWMQAHAAILGLSLVPLRLCGYRLGVARQDSQLAGE